MNQIVAKLDEAGRVVIPSAYRKSLRLRPGSAIILVLEEGGVRILTVQEAIRKAQSRVRRYVSPGRNLSEELIAERRTEA